MLSPPLTPGGTTVVDCSCTANLSPGLRTGGTTASTRPLGVSTPSVSPALMPAGTVTLNIVHPASHAKCEGLFITGRL
eukprot:159479-Prymnesium_polylepis.1